MSQPLLFPLGVLSQVWDMTTAPVVNGIMGGDVVLPCAFTHPEQNTYSGVITVQWLFRQTNAKPFFKCKMEKVTQGKRDRCLVSGSSLRFFLHEDPRESKLSLLVRNLTLTDNGDYYCRVELDYNKFQQISPTHLYVTGEGIALFLCQYHLNIVLHTLSRHILT